MYYSIRIKNLQKKNKKKTIFYILLIIGTITIFFFLGIKILVYFINIVSDLKKSNNTNVSEDIIPPKTPYVYPLSEYTSSKNVEIKGQGESSSTVELNMNNKKYDEIVGNDGDFIFNLSLNEGINEFFLTSKDTAGNISESTKTYKIIYDKTPPLLEIRSPQNNITIIGLKNKVVEIKGITEKDSVVTINDRFVYLSDTVDFVYKFDLSNGENKITIKSRDMTGNEEAKELNIIYQE